MPLNHLRPNFEAVSRAAELFDFTPAFVLRALCRVGVADHLADGPKTAAELATLTDTDEGALERALRSLVVKGVFREPQAHLFELDTIGEFLRSDHPLSMHEAFRLHPDVELLADLEYTLRTGSDALHHIFEDEFWTYLAQRPDLLSQFQATMRSLNRLELIPLLRVYDWARFSTLVDVGGNDGSFVSALLRKFPSLQATLFDLPETVAAAPARLQAEGVGDRCTIVAGNVFETPVPSGADAYTVKRVLVEFDDETAVTFLQAVRAAMAPTSRLLILEPLISTGDRVGPSLDILMLVVGKGRVRTPEDYDSVLGRAGLARHRTVGAGLLSVVEARPV